MTNSNINISIPINIRTLTPLAIGTDKGEVLSPYADFVFSEDGDSLHYLNLDLIEAEVSSQKKLDEYIRGIKSGMDNNRSDFSLHRFLTGSLKLDIDEITRREVLQFGLKKGEKRNINPTVKNAGQPYVPGTSIKGALRTAMLYDWFANSEEGESFLLETAAVLNQLASPSLNKTNLDALKEQVFDEGPLLGSLKSPMGPDARFLRVSDSSTLPIKSVAVFALKRIRLKPGGKSAIPQVVEAIQPRHNLQCTISVDPWLLERAENKTLEYLVEGNFENIFRRLSAFSTDCIANELFELRDATTKDFGPEVDKLIEFYENMQQRINEGAFFLRIGFGKTVNDNSLTLALANGMKDQTAFDQFRSQFHKLKYASDLFPVTRTITSDGLPMGWVEIFPGNK